ELRTCRMAVLLAALSACVFGVSDFLGGMSAKRIAATLTSVLAELSGLAGMLVVAVLVGGRTVGRDWAWGGAAGLAGGLAIVLFYWAMSRGQMSVVAPVTAVLSALVPLVGGLLLGERPSALALGGAVLAVVAIVLVSREPSDPQDPDEAPVESDPRVRRLILVAAAVSGLGFGLYFVGISRVCEDSGMWPIAAARVSAAAVVGLMMLWARPGRGERIGVRLALVAGLLDVTANALFLLASREGLLTLVGVIGAMYPASTLVLARAVLKERLAGHQVAGLGLAVGAVLASAAG
ncbi:MAG: EamA family transporter, partial [Actinomycetes bacterium]